MWETKFHTRIKYMKNCSFAYFKLYVSRQYILHIFVKFILNDKTLLEKIAISRFDTYICRVHIFLSWNVQIRLAPT
jgi:hypothetical protein